MKPTLFKAGAASIRITPDEPMWLAGFAVRTEPAKGIFSDLYARALAIEDRRGGRVVIVSVDLIAISKYVATKVCDEVKKRFGLTRDRVMLCATHTHYGPELRPDKVPFFHIPPEFAAKIQPFADRLATLLVDVIGQALDRLRPTELRTFTTTAQFANNRRGAEDPIDQDVPVLIADGVGDRVWICLSQHDHAAGGLSLQRRLVGVRGRGDREASAGTCRAVPRRRGADQNPEKGDADVSRRHGHALAKAILTEQGQPIDGEIRTAFAEVDLEYQPLPTRSQLEIDLAGD